MKKTIALLLVIALALIACDNDDNGKDDDDKDKYTPLYTNPAIITQATGLAFDGTVTIKTDDPYTPAEWDAVVANVITAFNAAYEAAVGPGKIQFENVFDNSADAKIVLVNDLANNWQVRDGEFKTLYLKTSSIATATYLTAVQRMAAGGSGVGKATPPKDRVFLATVTRQCLALNLPGVPCRLTIDIA